MPTKAKLFFLKLFHKITVIAYDILAIPLAWYFAYWLRDNLNLFPSDLYAPEALSAFSVLYVIQLVYYRQCGVYRGIWRFTSLRELFKMSRAVVYAVMTTLPVLYLLNLILYVPRAILPLYTMSLIGIWSVGRLARRMLWENRHQAFSKTDESAKRVLVVGAGDAGASLIRDLNRNPAYLPVGIIDDFQSRRGLDIHGVRVIGAVKDIFAKVHALDVDMIFIALPSATSAQMRRIVEQCEQTQIPFRTLPSLNALADGKVEINAMRSVSLEDLLGRDEVKLEWDKIAHEIEGKRIVVTGGGGSIGSELCRQILRFKPSDLYLIDHSEFLLYQIEQELEAKASDTRLHYALISVTDKQAVSQVFQAFKPQLVFHAAAYKHVPMLEPRVRSAVLNNVIGTQTVAEVSVACEAEKFILISTDKAVNPTNIMGATKRVAEHFCQNLNASVKTQFITVRFGNVLGSAGSVVPLFQKQIQAGGPITVTHPEIERFFMTIAEAAQLILQAMTNGKGGEIFVLDMGEPIKIRYLAEQMIKLSGKDIEIAYSGLRPGEKLFEELFYHEEKLVETAHVKLHQAIAKPFPLDELMLSLEALHHACSVHDEARMRSELKRLALGVEVKEACTESV